MKKQVAIIGLGQFGSSLAREVFKLGHDVLAIDDDEKKVQNIISDITHAVQADATDEAVLAELGVKNFDIAVVAMGESIQNNVLTTVILKKLNVPYVIARAENELHQSILEKIGADKVIFVEREMGQRVAQSLDVKNELNGVSVTIGYSVVKLEVTPQMVDKKLSDMELGRGGTYDLAVLLIQRGREVIFSPPLMDVVRAGDVLILSGTDDNIDKWLKQSKTPAEEKEDEE
ncbi:MAG: TrkA family potassium uptake protein [Anaerolineales bacterium]|nr:TrkA family potassium uptake protein [Anaerolineales bacterium]